jgi:hypothetical protein
MNRLNARLLACAGLALMLSGFLATRDAGVPAEDQRARALSRSCKWLASQQQPDGSIALAGSKLNPNVWETSNAVIALLRCDAAAHAQTVAKAFEFLDANWIETGQQTTVDCVSAGSSPRTRWRNTIGHVGRIVSTEWAIFHPCPAISLKS